MYDPSISFASEVALLGGGHHSGMSGRPSALYASGTDSTNAARACAEGGGRTSLKESCFTIPRGVNGVNRQAECRSAVVLRRPEVPKVPEVPLQSLPPLQYGTRCVDAVVNVLVPLQRNQVPDSNSWACLGLA